MGAQSESDNKYTRGVQSTKRYQEYRILNTNVITEGSVAQGTRISAELPNAGELARMTMKGTRAQQRRRFNRGAWIPFCGEEAKRGRGIGACSH